MWNAAWKKGEKSSPSSPRSLVWKARVREFRAILILILFMISFTRTLLDFLLEILLEFIEILWNFPKILLEFIRILWNSSKIY